MIMIYHFIFTLSAIKPFCLQLMLGFMMLMGLISDMMPKQQIAPLINQYLLALVLINAGTILMNALCYTVAEQQYSMPGIIRLVGVCWLGALVRPFESLYLISRYLCSPNRRCSQKPQQNGTDTGTGPESAAAGGSRQVGTTASTVVATATPAFANAVVLNTHEGIGNKGETLKRPQVTEWRELAKNVSRLFGYICIAAQICAFNTLFVPVVTN